MSHLMTHDHEQLVWRELLDDCIPQHDALSVADTGGISVKLVGIHTLVHFIDVGTLYAGAVRQVQYLDLQRLVLHRPEMVEERLDPDGFDERDEHDDGQASEPSVEPPPPGGVLQQQVRYPKEQGPGHDAYQCTHDRSEEHTSEL